MAGRLMTALSLLILAVVSLIAYHWPTGGSK
jgi:hypothetical protein